MTQSVFVDNSSSAELLRIGLGLPVGLFWFAGSPWLGPSTALIPGMLLVFQPSPFQAVGETTPQFAVLEPPLDGFQAAKAANVACAPAEIHQIPTPLRRRPRDAQSGTANRVSICLADSTVPPATAFALGIESSMIRFSLEGHGSEQLSQDLPASQRITPRLQRVWAGLPVLTSMHPPDELFLFTDGSFDPLSGASGWSVVALIRQGNSFGKLGAAWGPTRHSTDSGGAFNAELEALLHAEAFANRIQSPVTHLLSDCSSALQVGCGFAATTPADKIGRACIGLQILAASAGRSCRHHKVTAHADCIPNEIADALAKCAVFEASAFPCADCHCQFWDAVHEGALEWLWLTSRGSSPSLPFLNCDGGWSFAASTVPSSIGLTPPAAGPSCPFPFSLRILQYNCLSMKGSAAAALIAKGLHRQKIHFAGFQETRTPHDGIRQEGDFWVAASACNSRGQGGCQIWLHRKLSLATRDGLCHWDRKSMMIVRSSPRLLVFSWTLVLSSLLASLHTRLLPVPLRRTSGPFGKGFPLWWANCPNLATLFCVLTQMQGLSVLLQLLPLWTRSLMDRMRIVSNDSASSTVCLPVLNTLSRGHHFSLGLRLPVQKAFWIMWLCLLVGRCALRPLAMFRLVICMRDWTTLLLSYIAPLRSRVGSSQRGSMSLEELLTLQVVRRPFCGPGPLRLTLAGMLMPLRMSPAFMNTCNAASRRIWLVLRRPHAILSFRHPHWTSLNPGGMCVGVSVLSDSVLDAKSCVSAFSVGVNTDPYLGLMSRRRLA